MADWTKLHLIDALDENESASGRPVVGRYYMLRSDYASCPRRGDDASPMSSADPDLTGWRVNEVIRSAYSSTHYVVTIKATRYLGGGGGGTNWTESLLDEFSVSYEYSEILVSPEMLGLMAHDGGDGEKIAAPGATGGVYQPAAMTAAETRMTAAQWATYTPESCPFVKRPDIAHVGKKFATLVASVSYHTSKRANVVFALDQWQGVAATGGEGAWPIPGKYGLPNDTASGYWRVAGGHGLSAQPVTDPETGRTFYRVTRRLERVPLITDYAGAQVLWNPARNGGYMVW